MRFFRIFSFLTLLTCALATNSIAQERLCDTAFEDCRTPLWTLIDQETVGIDVAFWFMQDTSISNKIINKFNSGVPVRILVDPRANPTYAGNQQILESLAAAGIPMRYKLADGILHWKMMLFAGQNKIEFSGANYSPAFFVPTQPNSNYIDEAIYFTDDDSIIQSFKTKYDDIWTNTVSYGNYANITGPLTRKYPTFSINPDLNFPPSPDDSQDFFNRTQVVFNNEAQKIDIIMYRITNQRYTDTTIDAVRRGIPVRLIHEPQEYRNPARQWDSWNVDRLYMAGVQIKMRKHLGLNHQKSVVLYGQGVTIFGSSNWTGPSSNSQQEHNYFTTKPYFFQWFVNQFERKWNSTPENEPFVPGLPTEPNNPSPANGAVAQPTTMTLRWEGGPWAHKYDIYFGTSANPPLLVADASTTQSGAVLGQPRLDTGSVDDGVTESFTIPTTLSPGTTYYWRVVGKTMANKTATGPSWSFVTVGSELPPSAPTGLSATSISPTRIDLGWTDVASETSYRVERSANGSTGWTEIGNPTQNQTVYSDVGVSAQQTYFYRVRALNSGGFSPYSNVANATTPQSPPPAAGDLVLWAGEANVRVGNWQVVSDTTAAGASRIWNADAGAAKRTSALAAPIDYFEITFNAQAGLDYRLWVRSKAQNDFWGNDSVFVQFSDSINSSGTPIYRIGTTAAAEMNLEDCSGCGIQGWGWQDNGWGIGVLGPLIRFQSSGSHTLRIQVREDGLSIDQIVLSPQTYLNTAPGALRNDTVILPKSNGSVNPAPNVSSASPASGPTSGGTTVTISGSGFLAGATLSLGGTRATSVTVVNSSSITATTPAHAAAVVNVVVTNADGQNGTLANGFSYIGPPVVSGVAPSSGPTTGGTPITISGSGFLAGATVSLGGAQASNVLVANSSSITASTPPHSSGPVSVVVTNPDGQNGTLSSGFNYSQPTPAPFVDEITPNSGSSEGGTPISITGSNFVSGATLSLGGVLASNVVGVNSNSITAVTSVHAPGLVDVVVRNPDGQSGTLLQGFNYVQTQAALPAFDRVFIVVEENQSFANVVGSGMPFLTRLANRYGLALNYFANTQPSIGNYFWLTTGQVITNDSNFNGIVTADNIVRQLNLSGKTWRAYAESLPAVGYTGPDQYPYVKRHNPFAYFSDVLNNQAQANNLVPFSQFSIDLSNNQLPQYSFIIPNQLNNAHDCPPSNPSCTNTDKITTADQWLKTNVDPLIASQVFQNSLLVILFDESVNTDTQNGGGHVAMVVVSPKAKEAYQATTVYQHQNTLRMTAEALGLTTFPGASSTAQNMTDFFSGTANTAPIATSVSPASGPAAGGTAVSISGTGFTNGATVTFGGTAATSVNVNGSTTITATTPAHASGAINVVVTNSNGQSSSLINGFTYAAPLAAPIVSAVNPNFGTAAGGTAVTVSGTGFAPGATVSFGGAVATGVIVNSSTSISATTPAHAAGTVNIVATNPDLQSGTLANGFTYNPNPGGETILLADDFNDGSLNSSVWVANNLFSGFTDASIATVETQRLEIGPLKQLDGSHYNGIRSISSYDFTGAYAYVQLVQAPSSTTAADAFFTIGLNVDNCYRMYVEAGSLVLQRKVGGAKQTLASITFNASYHAFWRIRHDAVSGQVIFETAPANAGAPGAWTQVFSEQWNIPSIPLGSVSFELKGGTWRNEPGAPGSVIFDNFKAAKP
jgi:hypothetical protein